MCSRVSLSFSIFREKMSLTKLRCVHGAKLHHIKLTNKQMQSISLGFLFALFGHIMLITLSKFVNLLSIEKLQPCQTSHHPKEYVVHRNGNLHQVHHIYWQLLSFNTFPPHQQIINQWCFPMLKFSFSIYLPLGRLAPLNILRRPIPLIFQQQLWEGLKHKSSTIYVPLNHWCAFDIFTRWTSVLFEC